MSATVRISGANELYKKIDKLVKWSQKDSKKLQDIGHRVGAVYGNYIKANVKDGSFEKSMFRGKNKKRGNLRRSGGTWLPDRDKNTVMGGPRTNAIGRRKTRKNADGWYAHIVEKGDFGERFGGKHKTQNSGVFSRGMKSVRNRSKKLQEILLKREYVQYVSKL